MEESSLLETTAEVSVAFTGFIGIFLVLAARDGRFPPTESFSIRLIVICSMAPVFYAALPLILGLLGVRGALLWRVSSGAIGLAGIALSAHMALRLRSLPEGEGRALNYGVLLGAVAVLSCLSNALGWPWAGGNFVELLFRKLL